MSAPQSSHATLKMLRLREAALAQAFAYSLYNPADEPTEFECNGNPFVIPPDGPWTKQDDFGDIVTVVADGILSVADVRGVDKNRYRALKQTGRIDKANRLPKDTLLLPARDIVTHALKKRGVRGVVLLTGEPAKDAEIRALAKAAWVDFKRDCCERTLSNYRERTHAFHTDPRNRGQLPPPMTDSERAAQEWLDADRVSRARSKTYVCPVEQCGYDTDDLEKWKVHMAASHPRVAEASDPGIVPPTGVTTAEPAQEAFSVDTADDDRVELPGRSVRKEARK